MRNNPWIKLEADQVVGKKVLFCLPFAGGFAEYFYSWQRLFGDDIVVCPVQLPGRSYRHQEAPIINVEILIDTIIPVLSSYIQCTASFAVFGHSMGGYIAYMLLKALAQQPEFKKPSFLLISSTPSPEHWGGKRKLSEVSECEFENLFLELGGFPKDLLSHTVFIKQQMKLLKKDILLCESCYRDQGPLFEFPVIGYGAHDDDYVDIDTIKTWENETCSKFLFKSFMGGHFYLNNNIDQVLLEVRNQFKH